MLLKVTFSYLEKFDAGNPYMKKKRKKRREISSMEIEREMVYRNSA